MVHTHRPRTRSTSRCPNRSGRTQHGPACSTWNTRHVPRCGSAALEPVHTVMTTIVVEPQCCEVARRPSIAAIRRIADDAATTLAQQPASDPQNDQRGSEAPGRHHISRATVSRATVAGGDHGLHICCNDLDPIGQVERTDAVPEQVCSLLTSLDEREVEIRPIGGDHEAGQPPAGTEVDDSDVDPGHRFGQCAHETTGVRNCRIDRPAADRAAALDLGENSSEGCVVSHSPGR